MNGIYIRLNSPCFGEWNFPESLDAKRKKDSSPPRNMVGEAFCKVPTPQKNKEFLKAIAGPKIARWCCSMDVDVTCGESHFASNMFFFRWVRLKNHQPVFFKPFFHPPLFFFYPLKIWLFGSLFLLVSGTRKWGCVSPRLTHRGGWPIGTPSRWAFGSRSAAAGGIRFHAAGFALGLAADGITADSGTVVYLQHVTLAKNTNKNVEIWVIFNRIPR